MPFCITNLSLILPTAQNNDFSGYEQEANFVSKCSLTNSSKALFTTETMLLTVFEKIWYLGQSQHMTEKVLTPELQSVVMF